MKEIRDIIVGLEDNKDSYGLLVQLSGDGGDSLQRNSHYWILRQLSGYNPGNFNAGIYKNMMDKFEVSPGIYVRHPDGSKWYSNPNNCSRDQISVAMQCMVIMQDKERLKRVVLKLMSRFGFHQNYHMGTDVPTKSDIEPTVSRLWPSIIRDKIVKLKTYLSQFRVPDIIAPGQLATIIRGLNLWPLYPALYVLDLFLLGDLYFRKKNTHDYDNMMASQMLTSNKIYPTFMSKFALKLYSKTDYKVRIKNYYEGGLPLLGELYILICEQYIK